MVVIEIVDVAMAEGAVEHLQGCSIDTPTAGQEIDGRTVDIYGWALGRDVPVVAVEVVHAGAVVRRVPMNHRRPDVAAAFPDVPNAEWGGFQLSLKVNMLDVPEGLALQVRA